MRTPEPMAAAKPEPAEIVRRLEGLARSGNPDALWPDVSRARRLVAAQMIALTVSRALQGRATRLDDPDLPALSVAAYVSGIGPLLGRWIADGVIGADQPVARLFADHLVANRARTDFLAVRTRDLVTELRSAGVEPLAFKGLTVAAYYPEPGARTQSDIDLLINPGTRLRAEAHLRALGWRRLPTPNDVRRTTWRAPDAPTVPSRLDRASADDPWTLDLHATLDRVHAPRVVHLGDADTVGRATMVLAGRPIPILAPRDQFAVLVQHVSLGFDALQLARLVDLVLVARHGNDWWAVAADHAEAAANLDLVFPAAALVERLAPGTVPPTVMARARVAASPRLQAVVAAADPGTLLHRDARTLSQKLMWARSPLEAIRTLLSMMATVQPRTWRRRLHLLTERHARSKEPEAS